MKTFAFTIAIGALLAHGFNGTFTSVSGTLRSLNGQIKDVKQQQKQLNEELKKGTISAGAYEAKMAGLNSSLSGLKGQKASLDNFIMAKNQLGGALATFTKTGLAIYALAKPVVGMVQVAADYESAMSKVKAITGANDSEMVQLSQTARELGEQTKFTAKESADAMSYLGMAGWKANQIIVGMPGLLSLAAAGGTDLARTADIVSDNLTAFGLAADQSGHMADVYATVITNTNTNVELLGETMKYAAPVAKAFGASMEETAAMAGLMANAGIKGSQAGTSLRSGLMRLAGPPKMAANALAELGLSLEDITAEQKEAAMAMSSLGIEMSDVNGPRKMSAILTELRGKLQGLSQDQQLSYAKAIFGSQAAAGWLAVLNSDSGAFDDLVTKLEHCDGAAKKMADTMQANLNGAMTRLSSATESIAISFGQALTPALTVVADKLAVFAGAISQFTAAHPGLVQGIVTIGASLAGLALIITGAGVASAAFTVITAAFSVGLTVLLGPVGVATAAIAGLIAIGVALYTNWDSITAFASSTWESVKTTVSNAWEGIKSSVSGAITTVRGGIFNLPNNAAYAVGYMVGYFVALPGRILDALAALPEVGAQLVNEAMTWGSEAVDGIIQWFSELPGQIEGIISDLASAGEQFISEAADWGSQAVDALIDGFTSLPGRLSGIVSDAWENAKGILGSAAAGYAAAQGNDSGGGDVEHNANGGIYTQGAFLTTFAEESGESAIPHTPNRRNISLLARTNEIMGSPLGGSRVSAVFAPQITVNGGADEASLSILLTQKMQEFKQMLEQVQHERRRTAFA